jgi:hypothetical protein
MSDNKINSDAEKPLNGDTPDNNSEKESGMQSGTTSREESTEEKNLSDKNADQKTTPQNITSRKKADGNYQISLINKNLLKVLVLTKRGVKINSSVIEKKTNVVVQSNEIYLYPKMDFGMQEVEIMIELDENESEVNEVVSSEGIKESNFKFDTINENLLKVKLITERGIKIDSVVRDKKTSLQTQSNRIYLQPKSVGEVQEAEITIAVETESKDFREELAAKTDDGKTKLIPNPEVENLILPPDYSGLTAFDPYSTGDYTDEGSGFKNPFDALRKLIRKNLTIGIVAAVILHLALAVLAFYTIKKEKNPESEEQSRLIIIQDLPDPKIKLENVEDPNKPKVEEPLVTEPDIDKEPKREIPPRKIVKPPVVTRPKKNEDEKFDSLQENLARELDSLRKLLTQNETADTTSTDSTKDSVNTSFDIPDSLRNNFNEQDIGLAMYYPKSWKLIDQRDINKDEKEFKGVVITDTTAVQPGTMNLFISLDPEGKDFKAEDFKTEFRMNDSTLRAYVSDPKTLAGSTNYRFYIFNNLGTEKLSVNAQIRKQFFDQYKNEIEAVVRSIRIKRKEDL